MTERPATAALALLLLADGRFPTGAHAHSGGVEAAVLDGRVAGEDDLEAYLRGRLATAARVEAALAAASTVHLGAAADEAARLEVLERLDAEAGARLAVAHLRVVSRRLGRALVRAAQRCWPDPVLATLATRRADGVHQPVALGAVGLAAGLEPIDVARLAVHHVLAAPSGAAVRLLGLDPLAVVAMAARLAEPAEAIAAEACDLAATCALPDLPAHAGPLVDLGAVEHLRHPTRLFAS